MASSTMQAHAETLRAAVNQYEKDGGVTLGPAGHLCRAVLETAAKMAAPTPISAARKRRGDRNLMAAINGTPAAKPRASQR